MELKSKDNANYMKKYQISHFSVSGLSQDAAASP